MDDLLRIVGIGAIGIIGISLVLGILAIMCVVVGVFIYAVEPPVVSPEVTISPYDNYTTTPDYQYNSTLSDTDMSYGGDLLFDESKALPDNYYQYYSLVMQPGMKIDISVSTNGTPVDVMVIDSNNFGKYVVAVNSVHGGGGSWDCYVNDTSVTQKSFNFSSPAVDRYYVIIDNTKWPEGGAYANSSVNVHTVVAVV